MFIKGLIVEQELLSVDISGYLLQQSYEAISFKKKEIFSVF